MTIHVFTKNQLAQLENAQFSASKHIAEFGVNATIPKVIIDSNGRARIYHVLVDVLTGAAKRIKKGINTSGIDTPENRQKAMTIIKHPVTIGAASVGAGLIIANGGVEKGVDLINKLDSKIQKTLQTPDSRTNKLMRRSYRTYIRNPITKLVNGDR